MEQRNRGMATFIRQGRIPQRISVKWAGVKFRHAAAFALAALIGCARVQSGSGWVLILPPLSADGYADKSAPLVKWQTFGSYAGQTDCNAAIARFQFAVNSQVGPISHAGGPAQTEAVQINGAKCFAADDPRLAEVAPSH